MHQTQKMPHRMANTLRGVLGPMVGLTTLTFAMAGFIDPAGEALQAVVLTSVLLGINFGWNYIVGRVTFRIREGAGPHSQEAIALRELSVWKVQRVSLI